MRIVSFLNKYMFRLFPLVGFVSNISKENGSRVTIEKNIAKSFQESVNERIMGDIPKVLGSFLIMFIYVSLSLGSLNFVENRVILLFSNHIAYENISLPIKSACTPMDLPCLHWLRPTGWLRIRELASP